MQNEHPIQDSCPPHDFQERRPGFVDCVFGVLTLGATEFGRPKIFCRKCGQGK